jgi:hypothetical protein
MMTGLKIGPRRAAGSGGQPSVYRWECPCQERPVLLATYDAQGRINIKVRDRYWHVHGQVQAICPRCGAEHILDLRAPHPNLSDAEEGAVSGRR